jgi:hypothetical protein
MPDYTTGLIARYPLTANGNDSVGSVNGSAFSQAPSFSGGAAVFNGTDQAYLLNSNFGIASNYSRAWAVWIKTTVGGRGIIGQQSSGGTSYVPTITILSDGTIKAGIWNGTQTTISSPAGFNDGQWHHVVAQIVDATDMLELYVDGVSRGTPVSVFPLTESFWTETYLGYAKGTDPSWGSGDGYFSGSLYDFRLYNRALGPLDVKDLYLLGSPATGGGQHVKVAGAWRPFTRHVKVGGAWKATAPHVKVGGVWKSLSGGGSSSSRLWLPSDLGSDLIFWADFRDPPPNSGGVITDLAYLTNKKGGLVNPQFGNGNGHLIYANKALSILNSQAGFFVFNANGGNSALPSQWMDLAFVATPNAAGSWRTLMCNQGGNHHHVIIENATNKLGTYSTAFYHAGSSLMWGNTLGQLYATIPNANSLQFSQDGGTLTALGVPSFAPENSPVVMNHVGGNQGFGALNEMLILAPGLSSTKREQVQGYLAHGWDAEKGVTTLVSALPSGHPHKSAPPTVPL